MTTQIQPAKKTYLPESVVKANTSRSVNFVLTSAALNPGNYNYIKRMEEKLQKGKRLTVNEVAGLNKIEQSIIRDTKAKA